MNKILLTIVCLLLLQLPSKAQDAKAKQILDAVSANLKKMTSLKANFTLSVSKTKEKRSGAINMKGSKYFVEMPAQQIYCDAKTIYTFQKAANEVTINDFDPNENTLTPTKLFTNFYDKEFVSKYIGEKKMGALMVTTILLTPTKPKQFTKVELLVDKAKNIIVGGNVYEKNGNIMSYTVSNLIPNAPLADNVFVWDAKKHPKVEVVDLR
jgi:outer membrane lipoprotein carrier protein